MSMDLWYDLAARELPASDDAVIEKLHGTEGLEPAPEEPEPEPAQAPVDFF